MEHQKKKVLRSTNKLPLAKLGRDSPERHHLEWEYHNISIESPSPHCTRMLSHRPLATTTCMNRNDRIEISSTWTVLTSLTEKRPKTLIDKRDANRSACYSASIGTYSQTETHEHENQNTVNLLGCIPFPGYLTKTDLRKVSRGNREVGSISLSTATLFLINRHHSALNNRAGRTGHCFSHLVTRPSRKNEYAR